MVPNSFPIVFYNGSYCPAQQALIPFGSRATLFGDGLFTTMAVESGRIEGWQLHMTRLERQALDLNITFTQPDQAIALELIRLNQAITGRVKLKVIIAAEESPALHLPLRRIAHLYMQLADYSLGPQILRLGVFPEPILSPMQRWKSLAYLERLYLKEWALQNGFDDAIVTNAEGLITEASMSSLFWTRESKFYYPESTLPRLASIALETLADIAEALGKAVEPVKMKVADLDQGCKVYMANAMAPVRQIKSIEGREFIVDTEEKELFLKRYKERI